MRSLKALFISSLVLILVETAEGVEFEKMGSAVGAALKGVKKASKGSAKVDGKDVVIYYSKDASGKPDRFAVVQQGIYPPNCSHTWVVALDGKLKVDDIRVVELACTHAYPTREKSFLSQFYGRGPAQVKEIKSGVQTIAKATGSSELTANAVVIAIEAASSLKKTL